MEIELISKFLTEYQAIRVFLHNQEWIVWISKKTGAISCMTHHDQTQFIRFIQEKILPLAI